MVGLDCELLASSASCVVSEQCPIELFRRTKPKARSSFWLFSMHRGSSVVDSNAAAALLRRASTM
eukprot:6209223-Pleurochrysis_carterae.AAC.5